MERMILFICFVACLAKPEGISKKIYQPGRKVADRPTDPKPQILAPHEREQKEKYEAYVEDPTEYNLNKEPRAKPFGYPVYNEDSSVVGPKRRAQTTVNCRKNHMVATVKFSTEFDGYIYIHGYFPECILFKGQHSREAKFPLHHGKCAQKQILDESDPEFTPLIEHRLVIQWEKNFICEDDSSVIVRCDRPDDFNKTIAWDFTTLDLQHTYAGGQHPGPNMFMEIQVGEGPTAPPLTNQNVFIGDVLTLVFTLSDDVFWFDSNMLSCSAFSGGGEVAHIELGNPHTASSYVGQMQVIENDCSLKPKLFSRFRKDKSAQPNNLITTHYALFKAFRFPTSNKVVLKCDVRICYKECDDLPDCENPFHPRAAEHTRKRRDVGAVTENKVEPFKKTIVVYSKEDFAVAKDPVVTIDVAEAYTTDSEIIDSSRCYSPSTFFTLIGLLVLCFFALLFLLFSIRSSNSYIGKH